MPELAVPGAPKAPGLVSRLGTGLLASGRLGGFRGGAQQELRRREEGSAFKILDFDDVLLAAPRGFEGLVRSLGDLGQTIIGREATASQGERIFGRSDTLGGGILEGLSQFLLPFGVISKGLQGVGFLARGAHASRAAVAAGNAARAGLTAGGTRLAQGVLAGAGADFLAFSGSELRLSNLLNQFPVLTNPITEFLAADENDSEITGRLKNVIEGLGLGALIDVLPAALAATRAYRKALEQGAEDAGAAAAIARARAMFESPDPDDIRQAIANAEDDAARTQSAPDPDANLPTDPDPSPGINLPDPEAAAFRRAEANERAALSQKSRENTDKAFEIAQARHKKRAAESAASGRTRDRARIGASVDAAARAGEDPGKLFGNRFKLTPAEVARGLAHADALSKAVEGAGYTALSDLRKVPKEVRAALGLHLEGSINLRNLDATDSELALLRAVEAMVEPHIKNTVSEPQQVAEALSMHLDLADMQPEQLVQRLGRMGDDAVATRVNAQAVALTLLAETKRVNRLVADASADGTGSETVRAALDRLSALRVAARGLKEEKGRGLRAEQNVISADLLELSGNLIDAGSGRRLKELLGSEEYQRRLNQLRSFGRFEAASQMTAAGRFAEMNGIDKAVALTNEVVINNLLSAPRTLVTNFIFPVLTSFYLPLENMLGGALAASIGSEAGKNLMRREWDTIVGNFMNLTEAAHYARRSFDEGPILTAQGRETSEFAKAQVLRSDVLGISHSGGAALVDLIGKIVTFPSRVINATDEFAKQFTARGKARAELMAKAREAHPDDMALQASSVAENMDIMFRGGQIITEQRFLQEAGERAAARGLEPDTVEFNRARREALDDLMENSNFEELNPIAASSLQRAEEATATLALEEGTLGRSFQDFIGRHPVLRVITPFTRTPINLINAAGQRLDTPAVILNMLARKVGGGLSKGAIEASRSRNLRSLMSGDPTQVAETAGRIAAGFSLVSAASVAANAGIVTGGGPEDLEQRKTLLQTGWLPYSIKTPDGYVQYLRADPLSTLIGLAADTIDIAKFSDPNDTTDLQAVTQGLFMAASRNLVNKTYMTGVRSFLDAITRGERFAGNFIEGISTLPIPRSFQSVIVLTDDPVLREVHGITQAWRARLPFLSSTVPVQRNVFGEPIRRTTALSPASVGLGGEDSPANLFFDMFMPIAYTETKDDLVNTEFRTLREGFSPAPQSRFGINLLDFKNAAGRRAYDRWSELQGSVKVRGKTLKRAMTDLIRSREYQSLPGREALTSGSFTRSPKAEALGRIISLYREQSWGEMLREFPGLRSQVSERTRQREQARSGNPQTLQRLSAELGLLGS